MNEGSGTRPDQTNPPALQAGILVVSDRASSGTRPDEVGPQLRSILEDKGFEVSRFGVIPDEIESIRSALRAWIYDDSLDLVVTTGGTGLGPRDVTPEAVLAIADRTIQGLVELMRIRGLEKTPLAALSRQVAVQVGKSLVLALPGSPKGAVDSLEAVMPVLHHAFEMIRGADYGHGHVGSSISEPATTRSLEVSTPIYISGITPDPLDVPRLLAALRSPSSGAIVHFEGVARSPSEGKEIDHLFYEAYEPLANSTFSDLTRAVVAEFGLNGAIALHRVGKVLPGEVIVVAAAAAPHRHQAFEGARRIIERIKSEAPIWKKEVFNNGERWVGSEDLA